MPVLALHWHRPARRALILKATRFGDRIPRKADNLPVSSAQLARDVPLRWQLGMELTGGLRREEDCTYRSTRSEYPVVLTMSPSDVRTSLLSEEPATAVVELPLTAEVKQGRELIRDGDGRPEGAVERKFCDLSRAGTHSDSLRSRRERLAPTAPRLSGPPPCFDETGSSQRSCHQAHERRQLDSPRP